MLVEGELLGTGARIVTDLLAGGTVVLALASAPWQAWLGDRERQLAWLLSLGALVGIWSMRAGITPGLSVRFLLITSLTLMDGWHLAVIGAALVLVVLGVVGLADWASLGANVICMGVVPALCTAWLHELVHARLPHNYFVYFFVTVYVGSALAFNLAGLARLLILAASGTLQEAHVGAEYFAILPFMSFGEAFANGLVMAMAVVYRPRWVMSFDDRLYLGK